MSRRLLVVALITVGIGLLPASALAHCDAMDGPVVQAAETALARNDVDLVLRWVPREQEGAIRAAFARTVAVRTLGSEARALADRWFFETLVRIHRASEGAPFEGLKPAGHIETFVAAVDRSLADGAAEELIANLNAEIARGVRDRFVRAREARASADQGVDAGREYVAAYVEYMHYVQRLHEAGAGAGLHGPEEHSQSNHWVPGVITTRVDTAAPVRR